MKTYTSYVNDVPRIINNSLADNLTWAINEINDSLRYLITTYYFNERTYTVPGGTKVGIRFYNLPPQIKKLINVTVTIGSVLWQPKECPSRQYWDALNVIDFKQDFPSFFFIYNGQLGLFPTPATAGNIITFNYKTRVVDLSQADYTTGTVSTDITNPNIITGTGTVWTQSMVGQWLKIAFSATDAANGDNQWYQIDSVTNNTHLVLKNNYTGANVVGGGYIIGEASILPEDYQDLPLYRMAIIYYSTRVPDPLKLQIYKTLWDEGKKALDEEFGSKTTSIILTDVDAGIINPNLLIRSVNMN